MPGEMSPISSRKRVPWFAVEAALPVADGPCECAFHMPEELALEKVFRQAQQFTTTKGLCALAPL